MGEFREYSICRDAQITLKKAAEDGVETAWDRYQKQLPQCGYCELGVSCRICVMGPCRIDPFGEGPQRGVCGADAEIIVARNLARMIAAGAASHSDHGRDLVEVLYSVGKGNAPGYTVKDPEKLKRLAKEYSIGVDNRGIEEIAVLLAEAMMEDYGMKKSEITLLGRVPAQRIELWKKLRVVPRGIDRETSEMMHRTHMGVDNDYVSILPPSGEEQPLRRIRRFHDRHRGIGYYLRDTTARDVRGKPRRHQGRPCQHSRTRA